MEITTVPTILTLNAGSSSLRFAVFSTENKRTLEGKFDRVGQPDASLAVEGETAPRRLSLGSHHDCLPVLLTLFTGRKLAPPAIIAHRVVHGGPNHFDPTLVTPTLLAELRAIESFAPNHLPGALSLIEAAGRHWHDAAQIVCFDTAFHRDLPAAARLLPLPRRFVQQGVRRYGFHGLAYSSVQAGLARRGGGKIPDRTVLAHLGHGASLAVLRDGHCVDTTMGFTPIGGLVMSTRSGDLDPGVLAFVARKEKLSIDALERMVASESGLVGLSETSPDTRELLKNEITDRRAAEALAVFVHQARKAIGAATATLGGLDALVFSGGIGENSAELRTRICAGFDYLGLSLDPALNLASAPVLSTPQSRVSVQVIHADEELTLSTAARAFLPASKSPNS